MRFTNFPPELFIKCNSKLLRRLVVEIRNHLLEDDSKITLVTKIHATTKIFIMHTRNWEINILEIDE